MDYFPLFLDLKGKRVLVSGTEEALLNKIRLLKSSGAVIRLILPSVDIEWRSMALDCLTSDDAYFERDLHDSDFDQVVLAFLAYESAVILDWAKVLAIQKNVLLNVVDKPVFSDFIIPAIIDRSPIVVAVSSGGASPVLATLLRSKIEALLPQGLDRLASWIKAKRSRVKQHLADLKDRRRFWSDVLQGPIAETVLSGDMQKADQMLALQLSDNPTKLPGLVYLVGAGPGSLDYLTFEAHRALQQADVVFHDRLVGADILSLARREAHLVDVGKAKSRHTMPQEEIQAQMYEWASKGYVVCRLKGGDPFIFGRGGEEVLYLRERNIAVKVVSGITVAVAAAARFQIPLTHRELAQSLTLATGHLQSGVFDSKIFEAFQNNQTWVIYMGLTALSQLVEALLEKGIDSETPIALIEKVSLPQERMIKSTLAAILHEVQGTTLESPMLIIIGWVVGLSV